MQKYKLISLIFVLILISACSINPAIPPIKTPTPVDGTQISLPVGFSINLFAEVPGARSLALGANGTVFVGTKGDRVYAVQDINGDYEADNVSVIVANLKTPNGVAFKDGDLYVAEISRVLKFEKIESNLGNASYTVLPVNFPEDEAHGWKYIAFGPDDKLYVPVGAPCNLCFEPGYAALYRMNSDGSNLELFADGIRNTVGFDWHPETNELYFTDNGRDLMGDDLPPDELNVAKTSGLHFGFPWCHGKLIQDPNIGRTVDCWDGTYSTPVLELGPHVAALGMKFYTGKQFPIEYQNQIFIAEHGSWNRAEKIGYRVTLARFDNAGNLTYEVFADGWLEDGKVFGRPVDILQMNDGSLLISDDYAGKIYRIKYENN